ncbi:MAG: hypothetical protein HC910_21125 [Spirulinaceae cyanobacterium SM2_1_0]|nr:hypothetical protein [Spirulinaceae cyanobacterium SM2_1_0]
MSTANLTSAQVVDLVKQLSPEQQLEVFSLLLRQHWPRWESLSHYGAERARLVAAERDRIWDEMDEAEREAFIDDTLHETWY